LEEVEKTSELYVFDTFSCLALLSCTELCTFIVMFMKTKSAKLEDWEYRYSG